MRKFGLLVAVIAGLISGGVAWFVYGQGHYASTIFAGLLAAMFLFCAWGLRSRGE